jgi:Protein of Unknown function (DUF2784)
MDALAVAAGFYSVLATVVLFVHTLFILWLIFGALVAVHRPLVRRLHIASLIWGVLTQILPWPCPLTLLENWLEQRAGIAPDATYQGGFLLHYLDKLVYPDFPQTVLTIAAVIFFLLNLAFYARLGRMRKNLDSDSTSPNL